jgi:hypothetical protein
MGILHAVYGAGALTSPLVSTQFAQLRHWNYHYITALGVAFTTTLVLLAVFRGKTQAGAPPVLVVVKRQPD